MLFKHLNIKKKDLLLRKAFVKNEKKKYLLKSLVFNKKVQRKSKFYYSLLMVQPNFIFFTKIHNYCLFSGSSKSVYRKYKLNRVFLKSLINKGFISGARKASF